MDNMRRAAELIYSRLVLWLHSEWLFLYPSRFLSWWHYNFPPIFSWYFFHFLLYEDLSPNGVKFLMWIWYERYMSSVTVSWRILLKEFWMCSFRIAIYGDYSRKTLTECVEFQTYRILRDGAPTKHNLWIIIRQLVTTLVSRHIPVMHRMEEIL